MFLWQSAIDYVTSVFTKELSVERTQGIAVVVHLIVSLLLVMSSAYTELDEQIERLRKGDTLAENDVKALCEKVRWLYTERFEEKIKIHLAQGLLT